MSPPGMIWPSTVQFNDTGWAFNMVSFSPGFFSVSITVGNLLTQNVTASLSPETENVLTDRSIRSDRKLSLYFFTRLGARCNRDTLDPLVIKQDLFRIVEELAVKRDIHGGTSRAAAREDVVQHVLRLSQRD